ncbi:MAG: DUF1822 family protein, partial [Jaaginema sp. PMC 1079.18]|nr:DUF1822 family protein [Jaaginema sp. PMC 1079.18]
VSADAIAISQLQPFEQLLDYCSRSYPVQSAFANLRSWLDNTVEAGWQSVETLFTPDPQLLPVRGQAVADSPIDTDDITDIAPVLRLLQPNQAETIRRHAASVLGEIGQDNPEAISALVNLIENTQDEETRWQASLSLGKLSPHHPLAGIRQAKHLEIAPGVEVLFIISLMPKPQNRLGVDVQIEATQPASVLPANLTLSVIADGETRTTVTTRSDDRGVGTDRSMRRRFTPPPGTEFQVKVQWGDDETIETFVA